MAENSGSDNQEEKRRSLSGLLFWVGLLPVILGSLFCCAQLALLAVPGRDWSADTRSRLIVNYLPWGYQVIPPIKLDELIKDIEADERVTGTPRPIVTAIYWVPPTPTSTAYSVAIATGTPPAQATATKTPENPILIPSTTATNRPTATVTRMAPSITATQQPSATASPTATQTKYIPPPPTWTHTPEPQRPTNTRTPTPTRTPTRTPVTPSRTPVTPSRTPVTPSRTPVTPSATPVTPSPTPVTPSSTPVTPSVTPETPTPETPTPETPTPETPTPETPTWTPTYAPVWPIEEYEGQSTPFADGCVASFGYRNDNPQAVHIDIGPLNQISVDGAEFRDPQPTDFLVGRITGAFEVFWRTGESIFWSLDGHVASAAWCGVPVPTVP